MVKKFIKSIVVLGLFLLIPQFLLRSQGPTQLIDFESHLQPHDLEMLNNDEAMVYLSSDFIGVVKSLSSEVQMIKDLIEHVRMGYIVAPLKDVSMAVDHILKTTKPNANDYSIVERYHQALLHGDALIRVEEMVDRRRRSGKFCTLFINDAASIGCLTVRGNLMVGGSITACNFTGFTGGVGGIILPGVISKGNIIFNTDGTNTLNAQGASESTLNLNRATISLGFPGVTLAPVGGAGTALVVGIATPTSATITAGSGLLLGSIHGTAFSSGMIGSTPTVGTLEYSFIVDLQLPITFVRPYSAVPTITNSLQSINPIVGLGTSMVDATSSTVVTLSVSDVTTNDAVINILFSTTAQGASYTEATANVATAINNIISSGATLNTLSVNLIINGPVA